MGVAASVVCTGEIRAVGKGRGRGGGKRGRLRALLDTLPVLDISATEIVGAYASIQAFFHLDRIWFDLIRASITK